MSLVTLDEIEYFLDTTISAININDDKGEDFANPPTRLERVNQSQAMPLGQILVRRRLITSWELGQILELQKSYHLSLGEILIRFAYITPIQLQKALQEQELRSKNLWLLGKFRG